MNRVLCKSTLPGQKSSRVTSNTTIGHSTNPLSEPLIGQLQDGGDAAQPLVDSVQSVH